MSINSNSGHFDNLNSSVIPLDASTEFMGRYSSSLDFSTIEVSVKCDSTYELQIIYSSDSANAEFVESESVSVVSADTLFYKFEPKMRYFKIKIKNNDIIDQTQLSLNCLLKSSFVYSSNGGGINSDVNIISPLDGSGNVKVSMPTNAGSVLLANGFINNNTDSYHINFLYKNLTIYGSTDTNCILTLQLSDDNITYYPSQYSYTVDSGQNLGFNLPSGSYNYVRFGMTASVNNLILFLNYS